MNIAVTGASAGIGYETALQLAAEGHTVFAIARRKKKLAQLKEAAAEITTGARIHIVAGDLTAPSFPDEIAKEISGRAKSLDILIHNAGLLINKPFAKLSPDDWHRVYATNVFAVVNLTRSLLPILSKSARAHIVNISSMGGFQGSQKFKGLSAYSSSKAALAGISECLAEEFKELNIAVNCLCLGSAQTEMFSRAFPSYKAASTAQETAKFISRFALEGPALFNGKIIPVSNSTP